MVLRCWLQIRWMSPYSCSRVRASSAPKGSSIKRALGFGARARAKATRCFMPPDNSWTLECMNFLRPTRQTNSPSALRSFTSSSAWTFSVLVRNHFETCSRTSLEGTVLAGLISVAAISVQPFDEPRQVRCFAQESCPLGIRDELLILIRGNVCGRHDAFPCLGNQICRHLASCLGSQFLPDHLLGLIGVRENPLGEFTVGLRKLP